MKEPDFGDYADKLGRSAGETLAYAIEESRKRDQHYLSAVHLCLALLNIQQSVFTELLADPSMLKSMTEDLQKQADSTGRTGAGLKISLDVRTLFRLAWISSFQHGRNKIEAIDLLYGLTRLDDSPLQKYFDKYSISPKHVADVLERRLKDPIIVKMETAQLSDSDKKAIREAIEKDDYITAYYALHNFYTEYYEGLRDDSEPDEENDAGEITQRGWTAPFKIAAILVILLLIALLAAMFFAA